MTVNTILIFSVKARIKSLKYGYLISKIRFLSSILEIAHINIDVFVRLRLWLLFRSGNTIFILPRKYDFNATAI